MKRLMIFFLTLLLPSMALCSSLTNNSNEDISNLVFYDSGDSIVTGSTSISAQTSVSIPSTATYAKLDYPHAGNLRVDVSDIVSSNLFKYYEIDDKAHVFIQPDGTTTIAGHDNPLPTSREIKRIHFSEGEEPDSTTPTSPSTQTYGTKPTHFIDHLYIPQFAKRITDSTVRQAITTDVDNVINDYIIKYENWPNWNYIANLSLITKELESVQHNLIQTYPSSKKEINLFFKNLNHRITKLQN